MRVVIDATIRITNPSDAIKQHAESKLCVENPEYQKKRRMGLWVGSTPRTIQFYQTEGDDLILPYGTLRDIYPMLNRHDEIVNALGKRPDYFYGGVPVPLYDYQETAVQEVLKHSFGILKSKPASGKTQMGIAIAQRLHKRTLWLTHTCDLLNQSLKRAQRYLDKMDIGTITAGKADISNGITFATIQTLCKMDLTKLHDYWDVIIVDECHRVAGTPTSATMFSKVLNSLSAHHKYGLSATVHRADGLIASTFSMLGDIIYTVPDEAVKDRVMPVGVEFVNTGYSLNPYSCDFLNDDGTICYTKLITGLCESKSRNKVIADKIIQNEGQSCLILTDRLCQIENLISLLPERMKEDAVFVTGKMTSKKQRQEREDIMDQMRSGKKKYLFATYALAKEGLDIPCLNRLFLATPQKDSAVIEQSIGRVARTAEGKSDALAFDFVDRIRTTERAQKQRIKIYKKIDCYFVE